MGKRSDDPIGELVKKDTRYPREAYEFTFEALDYTYRMIGEKRHVTGRELLEGIKKYARQQFGMLGRVVFNGWGVYKTEDFGDIVFNLVETGLLGKTEQDSKEDFREGFDFKKAFRSL